MVAVAERKREHRPHAFGQCAGGEVRETLLVTQVRYLDGFTGGVGQDARSLAEFGLQFLVEQCRWVRGADVPGVFTRGDERDPGRRDRQHLDGPHDQVVKNGLDGEIRGHRAGELAEHLAKFSFLGIIHLCALIPLSRGLVPR